MIGLFKKVFSWRRKKFVQDAAILQVGSVFSTGLSFLASIVYARVLGVEGYASYVLIFAFVGLVSLFTNWGEQGVALTICPEFYAQRDKKRFKEVLIYYFFITLVSTFLVSLIAIFLAPQLTQIFYHDFTIGKFARIVLLMGMAQIFFFFLITVLQIIRKIKYLTIIENINKTFHFAIPVLLVLLGFGLWGLVYGKLIVAVIFMVFSTTIYSLMAKRNDFIPTIKELFFGLKYSIIKKYFRFGMNISINKNVGALFSLVPLFLLGFYGTVEGVAFYKIGYSYITLPMLALAPIARLLSVQLPASKAYGRDILKRDFWRLTFFSGFINFLLVIIFLLLATFLVKLFYGREFLGSLKVIYLLSMAIILSGFSIGFGSIFKTLRKVKISTIVNIITLLFTYLLIFFVLYLYGFDALTAVLIAQVAGTIFSFVVSFYLINRFLKAEDKPAL